MSDDAKTWLTPAAHQKLVDEYANLTTEGRRVIEERIAEARSHGDLRENAEYDTAKNDQGFMEARIREIKHILDNGEVREVANSGTVEVGTIATVVDDDGDELDFFVAPAENKVGMGILLASPESPLGAALLGAHPGDVVTYKAPGGTFTYKVVSIRAYEG
jgi:transcription elongation factor GreA